MPSAKFSEDITILCNDNNNDLIEQSRTHVLTLQYLFIACKGFRENEINL